MTALVFEGELEFPDYPTDLLSVKRFIVRPDGTLSFHMVAQYIDGNLEVSGTTKPANEFFEWKTVTTAKFVGSKRSLDVEITIFRAAVPPDGAQCNVQGLWHDKGSGDKWQFEGILECTSLK